MSATESDLAQQLLTRIEADLVLARAATEGPWYHDPSKEWHDDPVMLARARAGMWAPGGEEFVDSGRHGIPVCVAVTGPSDDPQSIADADHVARWHPARVIAQCEAAKRVVERHNLLLAGAEEPTCSGCSDLGTQQLVPWPCLALRELAAVLL